jgi:hypothetical protein
MRQTALGLFPTHERSLKLMSASRISRNGALVFLVVANLLTIPLFLYFSSKFWAPLIEGGPGDSPVDALLWGRLAFPWLAAGAIINISIFPKVIIEVFYRKDFQFLFIWCACVLIFFSAWMYDNSRQPEDYLAPGGDSSLGQLGHKSKVK